MGQDHMAELSHAAGAVHPGRFHQFGRERLERGQDDDEDQRKTLPGVGNGHAGQSQGRRSQKRDGRLQQAEAESQLVEQSVVGVGQPEKRGCHGDGGDRPGQHQRRPAEAADGDGLVEQDRRRNGDHQLQQNRTYGDVETVSEGIEKRRVQEPAVAGQGQARTGFGRKTPPGGGGEGQDDHQPQQ